MPSIPLAIITEVSAAHHAKPVELHADHAILDVAPPSVSGAPGPTYRLRIDSFCDIVTVREDRPLLLPACCPERHINRDGSFCLSWEEAEPLCIADVDTASQWFGKVLIFLRRQRTAATRRHGLPSRKGGHTAAAPPGSNRSRNVPPPPSDQGFASLSMISG